MSPKRKTHILQLDDDNVEKELHFELDFQRTLTIQQRFTMMFKMSNLIKEMLIKNGHRKPVETIQRR